MNERRGRKPTPTGMRYILNSKPRPNSENEPRPKVTRPGPPSHLNADAELEWERMVEQLYNLGIMTDIDRTALAIYCQAYGRWSQAERALAKVANTADGLVIKTKNGNLIQNPLVGIANKSMQDTMRYITEFGLTPASRTKIAMAEREMADDPAAEFLQ